MEADGRKNKKKLVLLPRQTHAHINANDHGDGSDLLSLIAAARCELSPRCVSGLFLRAPGGGVSGRLVCAHRSEVLHHLLQAEDV